MFKSEYTCLFMEVGLEEAQRGESRRCSGVLSHMSRQISVEATGQAEDSHPESPPGAPQTQGGERGVHLLRPDIRVTKSLESPSKNAGRIPQQQMCTVPGCSGVIASAISLFSFKFYKNTLFWLESDTKLSCAAFLVFVDLVAFQAALKQF